MFMKKLPPEHSTTITPIFQNTPDFSAYRSLWQMNSKSFIVLILCCDSTLLAL